MKLAEALILRADAQKKIASLRARVVANVRVQEGNKPSEDPDKLMTEAFGALDELEALVLQINECNLRSKVAGGLSITAAISRRDALVQRHSLVQAALAASREQPERYSTREIKSVLTIDAGKMQKHADDLAKKIREINTKIQEANWKIELKA